MGSLALVSGILMTLQGVIIQLNMPSFCRVTSFLQHKVLENGTAGGTATGITFGESLKNSNKLSHFTLSLLSLLSRYSVLFFL